MIIMDEYIEVSINDGEKTQKIIKKDIKDYFALEGDLTKEDITKKIPQTKIVMKDRTFYLTHLSEDEVKNLLDS